jgi:hypothetical protein
MKALRTEDGVEALRLLARALAPYLREIIAATLREHEVVDVLDLLPGVDKRQALRRTALRACREGQIAEASKIARRWVAPRASVEAWLRSHGPRPVTAATAEPEDDLEEVRRSLSRPARGRRHAAR